MKKITLNLADGYSIAKTLVEHCEEFGSTRVTIPVELPNGHRYKVLVCPSASNPVVEELKK
jgi:hypothetical protein